ncbi:MAG: hypothetical protein LC808_15675, partial [Actinobacteria bacterium]|nr:hypothetical protein [Actinomycetota bacterium]
MTINDLPSAENDAPPPSNVLITPPPDDVPPAVFISLPTGAVRAGAPTTITLSVDHGTHWVLRGTSWKAVPAITFSEMILDIQNVETIRD